MYSASRNEWSTALSSGVYSRRYVIEAIDQLGNLESDEVGGAVLGLLMGGFFSASYCKLSKKYKKVLYVFSLFSYVFICFHMLSFILHSFASCRRVSQSVGRANAT